MGEGQPHSSLEVQQGLQPLARGCAVICKADAAKMPKELQMIVSEAVNVTVNDYEVYGFTPGGPYFVPKPFRLPLCVDDNDDVLPHKDSLEDKPISLLPFSSLFPCMGCSLSAGSRATVATKGRCTRHRTWVHQQSKAMASLTLLPPLISHLLLPFFLLGALTRLLPSSLVVMMMAFFPLLTSPPVFFLILASGHQDLPPGAWVCLRRLLLHLYLV